MVIFSGKEIKVRFSGAERRKGEVMDTIANIEKAKKVLGWKLKIGINKGLKIILNPA